MSEVKHGACGKSWKQRGNRSGHCSGCHVTFYGITAFDQHHTRGDGGGPICVDPATGERGPWWLDADGVHWHHGAPMTEEQKRKAGWVA